MRRSCDSSMYWWSSSASARADSPSWPNGFSTTIRAFFVDAGLREALDDPAEEERRDLEVEDRALRAARSPSATRSYVAASPKSPWTYESRSAKRVEHRLVELLARADDRVARALDELVDRPVVDGDADDRALEQPALLEPVQRMERHHLGQVAGDPEDHEDVGLFGLRRRRRRGGHCCARHLVPPPLAVSRHGSLRHAAATPVICSRSLRTRR